MPDTGCPAKFKDIDAILDCELTQWHAGRDHEAHTSSGYLTKWNDNQEEIPTGAWVVYRSDMGEIITLIFAKEIEALRAAMSRGFYEKVKFLTFGEEMSG